MNRIADKEARMIIADNETNKTIIKNVKMYNKLADLEDVEDELGIELINLINALKNGAYFKRGRAIVFYRIELSNLDLYLKRINIFNTQKWNWEKYPFNCFGKTWALSKKDLKNNN